MAFRVARDISEFYLVGHLLGGYLSSFYANKYPKHVKKQVILSPVGFSEKPNNFNLKCIEV